MEQFLVRGGGRLQLAPEKRKPLPEEEEGPPAGCARGKRRAQEERPPGGPRQLPAGPWRDIRAEGLNCSYALLFAKAPADALFRELEQQVEYFEGTGVPRGA